MNRQGYLDEFRYWFEMIDRGWDEKQGVYVPADAGGSAVFNATMLPCLAVMGLEGDTGRARRIPRIIERLIASPPWDPEYHYWNHRLDRMGMEPHGGGCGPGYEMAKVYLYRNELDLPADLLDAAMDMLQLTTTKLAEAARRAAEYPCNCYIDAEGNVVNAWAIKCDAIRRGVPEDMRWLREGGPSNQLGEIWAASMGYLATRREAFWEHARLLWGRIIERVENGRPFLFRSCMDPDYSFIYSMEPQTEHGLNTHRYTQSIYGSGFLILHGNAVRLARKAGRTEAAWEEMVRNYAHANLGRTIMRDGTCNMVFNSYGWERSFMACYARFYGLHPLIPIADLTPFTAGQLVHMVDESLRKTRESHQTGYSDFPRVLGLRGFHRAGSEYTAQLMATTLAEMILTNQEAMEIEADPEPPFRCYSGFAWEQKHFVMQTPTYSLTVVGAGPPCFEDKGYLGLGMIASGGEYVLKLHDGPYLTPLSNAGRALMSARVMGDELISSDVNFFNRNDYGFTLEVILPGGTRINRGDDFGPSPYDPETEGLGLEVGFGKGRVRLIRRFDPVSESVTITDSIEALDDVEVEHFFSRLPVITVDPMGDTVVMNGVASGRPVEIKPPCHMGYEGDMQHYDRDFVQSISDLERLDVSYPSGYGFTFERLDRGPVRLEISRGEWQENRRMRVDGKNIDYYWISQPTKLEKAERRSFSYMITPKELTK